MRPEGELLERIVVDPAVLTGKPTVRGLRLTVDQIIRSLAAGLAREELLADYPDLEPEDIQACLLYAARLVEEERVYPITT